MACIFCSGVAALIYQVAWSKSLGLLLGYTVHASATVLAVFMAGLAAGSIKLGQKVEKAIRPITLYGWVELGVAVTGAASLPGLALMRWMYYAGYPHLQNSPLLLLLFRTLGVAIVLFIPSFLMGGTFPILIRGLISTDQGGNIQIGQRVSRLYWVNTLGAAVGATMAGFYLLPTLGLQFSIVFAVFLNVVAGAVALSLSRRFQRLTALPSKNKYPISVPLGQLEGLQKPRVVLFLYTAFGIVAGTAICYEITCARLLTTARGSSTYAFTLMLATFLLGVAIGSVLYERWSRRRRSSITTFALTQSFTAFSALLFLVYFQQLPTLLSPILQLTGDSFNGLLLGQFAVAGLAMLPTAIVFGFNFPVVIFLIVEFSSGGQRPAELAGRAYAANTLGAILSAVMTGFFLVPWLGSFRVVALAAVANILLALSLVWFSASRRLIAISLNLGILVCILIAGWSSLFYDRALASFSTLLYRNLHSIRLTVQEMADTEDIPFLEDGLNATISVSRSDDYVALKSNGKIDASNVDANTQILLGDLGAVFHPNPRRVLVIGFGSGMTASAVSRFPEVEQVDCIEIEPAVLHAAPYMEKLSRGVLRDSRLHLTLDDARNVLLTSRQKYDLIISEPSNPWIAGVAALFTDEFYSASLQHLAAGGMFVQWVQGYSLEPSDLQMILATITPHFSDVTLWHSAGADFLILARTQTGSLDFSRSRALWSKPQLHDDFSKLQLTRPEGWPVYFRLSDSQVRALAAGADHNTDDRPLLEYRAPRALMGENRRAQLEALVNRFRNDVLPDELLPSEKKPALEAAAESGLDLNLNSSADYIHALDTMPTNATLEILRGRLELRQNRTEEAIAHLSHAISLDSENIKAMYWLAVAKHSKSGDSEGDVLLARVLQLVPSYLPALASRVAFARDRREWRTGAGLQEERIAAMKDPPAAEYCALGDLWIRAGELISAESALKRGLELDPYSFLCHRELGEVNRIKGRLDAAREHLEFVVRMYPETDPGTYASLAFVYRAQKQPDRERAILARGLRIFPGDPLISRISSH